MHTFEDYGCEHPEKMLPHSPSNDMHEQYPFYGS